MIKAIILDIDGTLVNNKKQITEKTKEALIQAQEQGCMVVLASGRPTSGMLHLVQELRMSEFGGHLIAYNGACVIDVKTGTHVYEQAMRVEESKAVLRHLENFDVIPMITKDDYLYVNDVFAGDLGIEGYPSIIQYESRGGNYMLCEKDNLADFVDFPLYKILVAGRPDYLKAHAHKIHEPFENQLNSMFTGPFYYEFTAEGVDKAFALDKLLKPLNIQKEEVIAFGDGHNDLTLLNYAGIAVAMGNAVDELKAIADFVTHSNQEDGIAHALEQYLQ